MKAAIIYALAYAWLIVMGFLVAAMIRIAEGTHHDRPRRYRPEKDRTEGDKKCQQTPCGQ